eukprot:CAMPEP_0113497682 /NCGR_PEP_ID=MMETSP0014_2-20120614/30758_1 /TAXON_ID=2857 /ORGANISM="Nitzschia sp." /LENGTH=943 /DNA_ID=CAMNT_0000391633 /DNA_START=249 /DNA_END=3080 /DNA_ORIENTATION=- /assembly_acc=CAM_ASM_000159
MVASSASYPTATASAFFEEDYVNSNGGGGFTFNTVPHALTFIHRLLEDDDGTNSTTSNSTSSTEAEETYNDAATIRNTLRIYGSLFVVLLVLFCYLRKKFPRAYNVRSWAEDIQTPLAERQYGYLSWMWKVYLVSDSEMLDECGMDALCYARVLEFGVRLSVMGMLVGAVLMPIYATSEESEETAGIDDAIVQLSTSNVPTGSRRFIATVIGAYVIFGYTMYNMMQEFQWFYMNRYTFLKKPVPRNYAVYVQNIPEEYQTRQKLYEYFSRFAMMGHLMTAVERAASDTMAKYGRGGGDDSGVYEAVISLQNPNLKKKVAKRDGVVASLEHTINIEDVTGKIPEKNGVRVSDTLYEQLQELNVEVTESINSIEKQQQDRDDGGNNRRASRPSSLRSGGEEDNNDLNIYPSGLMQGGAVPDGTVVDLAMSSEVEEDLSITTPLADDNGNGNANSSATGLGGSALTLTSNAMGNLQASLQGTMKSAASLFSSEDGKPMTAGFVTFRSLSAVYAAQQMVQYPEPFAFEVKEAPGVKDIFWNNVGKTHKQLQIGRLISVTLTTVLCLFWTIPMSFISTLSTIEGLRAEVAWIDDLLTKQPWLEPLLAQLAPLLIVVAQQVLRMILELMSGLEGPVSGAVVQASLFSKLAVFMIVQTFFVSALSGSIMSQLSLMIQQPTMIVDLLANTLPTRSTYFIQILLVDTSVSLGLELLRVVPLAIAGIRGFVGPRLTQKERETTWMGLRPLADGLEFEHADLLSGSVLYFVVFFVYAVLAPITSYFMFICFILMGAGYRQQFIYIYPIETDSGGRLWIKFMRLVPVFMIIAQVTLVGFLALKRTPIGSALMFPLLIITIIFTVYINQQHFAMCENLPANACVAKDDFNNYEGPMNMDFLDGQYVQPELKEKLKYPENTPLERQEEITGNDLEEPGKGDDAFKSSTVIEASSDEA